MIPKPPAVGVVKVTWTQACSGRTFGDSLYFQNSPAAPYTTAQLGDLATIARTAWGTFIAPLQNPACSLIETTCLDLSDEVGRVGSDPTTVVGTNAGTKPVPLNTVAHFALEVPRRYRGGRPGFNLSGLDGSMMSDERTWSSATTTLLLTALSNLIGSVEFGGDVPITNVGVSYVANGIARLVPLVLPIIAQEVQKRVCTLRKRMGKGIVDVHA